VGRVGLDLFLDHTAVEHVDRAVGVAREAGVVRDHHEELVLDELLVQRRTQLRTQRDHLAAALEAGDAWDFTTPDGGLTIWLRVHGISARTLVDRAHRQGLALAHGTQFAIEGGEIDRIRIPFTAHPEALDRAVAILQNALERPPDGAEEHARPAFGRVGDTGLDTIY